jgi:hypothetical protein
VFVGLFYLFTRSLFIDTFTSLLGLNLTLLKRAGVYGA